MFIITELYQAHGQNRDEKSICETFQSFEPIKLVYKPAVYQIFGLKRLKMFS